MSTETSPVSPEERKRVTTQTLQEMKLASTPIAMLTAYDYTSARILDQCGLDVILVGDSASNVMAGHDDVDKDRGQIDDVLDRMHGKPRPGRNGNIAVMHMVRQPIE